jgi:hypothetical protein
MREQAAGLAEAVSIFRIGAPAVPAVAVRAVGVRAVGVRALQLR